jgi:hypothetical protein
VIDDESRVCGYIVASDYDSNISYFRPMDLALRNIRNVLRAKTVCLPDVKAFHAQSSKQNPKVETSSFLDADDISKAEVGQTSEPFSTPEHFRMPRDHLNSEVEDIPASSSLNIPNQLSGVNLHEVTERIQDQSNRTILGTDWFCCICIDGGGSIWDHYCANCRHGRCSNCHDTRKSTYGFDIDARSV